MGSYRRGDHSDMVDIKEKGRMCCSAARRRPLIARLEVQARLADDTVRDGQ